MSADLRAHTRAPSATRPTPRASAWVSANAGTGKTHVLTHARACASCSPARSPERILCLTYTKAAAAEMSKRVFDTLARWVTLPEPELRKTISRPARDREPADTRWRMRARCSRCAIETPGGLKVQTIHAFCERLLQRFPLEAGVAPGFTILDEATATLLQREAIDASLRHATASPGTPAGEALAAAIAYAADDRFEDILRAALQRRRWLEDAVRMAPTTMPTTRWPSSTGAPSACARTSTRRR